MNKLLSRLARLDPPDPLKVFVVFLTALSLLFIIVGHWKIVGDVFDPGSGEVYNLFTRWVSDFAAKNPEGWWIKVGMLAFCLALALFFRRLAREEATNFAGVWRGFGVLLVGSSMIGGLVLVAVFDLSPRQYEIIESRVVLERARAVGDESKEDTNWWEVLFDQKGLTLREELLVDSTLTEEEFLLLRAKILAEGWEQEEVRQYLREVLDLKVKLEAEADVEEVETRRELRALPRGKRELSKQWYHRLGFQMFLAGFVTASIWLARREFVERRFERLPGTLLGLCLTLVFGLWLMSEKLGLAGVPQRALLVLIGYWLTRNLAHIRGAIPRTAPRSADDVLSPTIANHIP